MGIRKAEISDTEKIGDLLRQLGYDDTESFLTNKLEKMLMHPDEEVLVYEEEGEVVAFLSLHFIPQIALQGDFARISYFSVDEEKRSKGIGKLMEEYVVELSGKRNCDRIELHSHSKREEAHKFYYRQGYTESPKYLIKKL